MHSIGRITVMHKLMTNPHHSSDKERMDDMTILLFAGYDTTACTLSWAFLDLAKYPEEQDKLRNILNKLDPDERAVCRDLRYFLNESMRLNSVVPGGFCQTTRDFYVKSDKSGEEFFIPSGSTLQMNHYYMSRDEIYFPDPLTFNPSRWRTKQSSALVPFSLGRRSCIGQSLASAELHNVLAHMIVHYKFKVINEGVWKNLTTWRPQNMQLDIQCV